MTIDVILRTAAVVAAAALVAAPGLVATAQAAFRLAAARLFSKAAARPEVVADDACTVITIARRLQESGNVKGVDICQQLIGVLLNVGEKKR